MKIRLIILLLGLGLGFVSCAPDLTFSEPQPQGNFETEKFKSKFRGEFLCLNDSSTLKISKTKISQYWHFEVRTDSISKTRKSLGEFYFDSGASDVVIQSNKDSTHLIIDFHKTLFEISDDVVLKYDRGIYFLNFRNSNSSWEVKMLHFFKGGKLILKELELNRDDLEKLKKITEVAEEKNEDGNIEEYKIKPTKSEFNQLLNSEIIEEGQEFIRIRN